MKLRLSKDPEPAPEAAAQGGAARPVDDVLDALAAILRALAETSLRGDQASEQLERWARHVLVLEPAPGGRGGAMQGRDWSGLRRDVVAHVHDDRAAATTSMDELQEAVWLVVDGMTQAIVGNDAADQEATQQLERLREAAGADAAELKATVLESVQRLSQIIDERSARQVGLARELGERVELLRVELDDTRREVDIDPLTKLSNRSVLQRELPRAVQVRTLVDEPACLAVVDLDNFKEINDRHGHQTGDSALCAFAEVLIRSFPRRGDLVARFGGDEFAVIMRNASAQEACRLAERFLVAVRELQVAGAEGALKMTASVGVAEAHTGDSSDDWFARADRALYQAKGAGRDRVAVAAWPITVR